MRPLPPRWATLATRKGITASARGIADRADVATTTVTRLIFEGRSSRETIRKVADALGVDQQEVTQLAGIAIGDLGLWDPPAESHKLDGPTRDALDRLIRAIVNGGSDGVAPEAQKIDVDVSPRAIDVD